MTRRRTTHENAGTEASHPDRDEQELALISRLLESQEAIRREIAPIAGGVRTLATAEDPDLAASLRIQLPRIHLRLRESEHLRTWDPLYRALYANRERIEARVEELPNGVVLEEVSDDPRVARWLQQHADLVNTFVTAARRVAFNAPRLAMEQSSCAA